MDTEVPGIVYTFCLQRFSSIFEPTVLSNKKNLQLRFFCITILPAIWLMFRMLILVVCPATLRNHVSFPTFTHVLSTSVIIMGS